MLENSVQYIYYEIFVVIYENCKVFADKNKNLNIIYYGKLFYIYILAIAVIFS